MSVNMIRIPATTAQRNQQIRDDREAFTAGGVQPEHFPMAPQVWNGMSAQQRRQWLADNPAPLDGEGASEAAPPTRQERREERRQERAENQAADREARQAANTARGQQQAAARNAAGAGLPSGAFSGTANPVNLEEHMPGRSAPVEHDLNDIANRIMAGEFGNGDDRMAALRNLGLSDEQIRAAQGIVNAGMPQAPAPLREPEATVKGDKSNVYFSDQSPEKQEAVARNASGRVRDMVREIANRTREGIADISSRIGSAVTGESDPEMSGRVLRQAALAGLSNITGPERTVGGGGPFQTGHGTVLGGAPESLQALKEANQAHIDRENARRNEEQAIRQSVDRIMAETTAQTEARYKNMGAEVRADLYRLRNFTAEDRQQVSNEAIRMIGGTISAQQTAEFARIDNILEQMQADNISPRRLAALQEMLPGRQGLIGIFGTAAAEAIVNGPLGNLFRRR